MRARVAHWGKSPREPHRALSIERLDLGQGHDDALAHEPGNAVPVARDFDVGAGTCRKPPN